MTRPWEVKSSSSSLGPFGRNASNNDLIPPIPVRHRVRKILPVNSGISRGHDIWEQLYTAHWKAKTYKQIQYEIKVAANIGQYWPVAVYC